MDKDSISKGRRVSMSSSDIGGEFLVGEQLVRLLNWTGFRARQTLWAWLNLLDTFLAAVTIVMALAGVRARRPRARPRSYQKAIIAVLAAGWIVTLIGGYALAVAVDAAMPEIPYRAGRQSCFLLLGCSRLSCFHLWSNGSQRIGGRAGQRCRRTRRMARTAGSSQRNRNDSFHGVAGSGRRPSLPEPVAASRS